MASNARCDEEIEEVEQGCNGMRESVALEEQGGGCEEKSREDETMNETYGPVSDESSGWGAERLSLQSGVPAYQPLQSCFCEGLLRLNGSLIVSWALNKHLLRSFLFYVLDWINTEMILIRLLVEFQCRVRSSSCHWNRSGCAVLAAAGTGLQSTWWCPWSACLTLFWQNPLHPYPPFPFASSQPCHLCPGAAGLQHMTGSMYFPC